MQAKQMYNKKRLYFGVIQKDWGGLVMPFYKYNKDGKTKKHVMNQTVHKNFATLGCAEIQDSERNEEFNSFLNKNFKANSSDGTYKYHWNNKNTMYFGGFLNKQDKPYINNPKYNND